MADEESDSISFNEAVFHDYRRSLINTADDQARIFDRSILGLSSGAFGLSMIFLKDIAGIEDASGRWFLMAAWGGFLVAILANLWSYRMSWKSCQSEIARADRCYRERREITPERNRDRTMTMFLNTIAFCFFGGAVISLAVFVFLNL